MSEQLDRLIAAVEAGSWEPQGGPNETWVYPRDFLGLEMEPVNAKHMALAYEGSLDAAQALHDALLPGWSRLLHGGHHGAEDFGAQVERVLKSNRRQRGSGRANTMARAWLLAILRAYKETQA